MTAATGRVPRNIRTAREALPSADKLPLAADVAPFAGWLMARNSSGYGVPFTETIGLISAGRAQRDQDAGSSDGEAAVLVDTMVEDIDQSSAEGDSFVDGDAPAVAYGIDNNTIGKNSTGRSIAGVFLGINPSTGKARLWSGVAAHAMAIGLLSGAGVNPQLRARGATTANLAASLSGIVLTADANGALGTIDGISDLAVGQKLLVKNQSTGAANGLYVITSLGSGSTKFVLTRAAEFDVTAETLAGLSVYVSEGTQNGNQIWDLTTDDAMTLGTTSLSFTKRPTLAEFASTSAGKGSALIGYRDQNAFTSASDQEAVNDELYQNALSSQGHIALRPSDFYLLTGAPLAAFSNGASAVPGSAVVDSKAFGVRWNNNATLDAIVTTIEVPPDMDVTANATLSIKASKIGATLADATTFTVALYNQTTGALHDADADFGGVTSPMTGDAATKTIQSVTRTLALADLAGSPAGMTLILKPTDGTLDTDDVVFLGGRITYQKKLLTS